MVICKVFVIQILKVSRLISACWLHADCFSFGSSSLSLWKWCFTYTCIKCGIFGYFSNFLPTYKYLSRAMYAMLAAAFCKTSDLSSDHVWKQTANCRKISLRILSNMSKFIIKSLLFCIENGLIEFGIPEKNVKKIWFLPHTLSLGSSWAYWVNWVSDGSKRGNDSNFYFRTNLISPSKRN